MSTKLFLTLTFLIILAISVVVYMTIRKPSNEKNNPQIEVTSTSTTGYKIVAFGDSLTAGYGVPIADSYPSILEKKLQEKTPSLSVINMGVSGETTSGGLERVAFIIEQQPSLVLLGLGANDMLRSLPPTLVKENLDKIIQALVDKNIPIILLGMQSTTSNGSEYKKQFDSIYPDLAKKYKIPLVPFFLEGVALRPTLNIDDGIHPNRSGYEIIVTENILPVVTPIIK